MHYIKQLVAAYPTIREVWLYGSRANGTERVDSDWDYLAYADKSTLDRLALDVRFDREDVDLMIVVDGNRFLKPWLRAAAHGRKARCSKRSDSAALSGRGSQRSWRPTQRRRKTNGGPAEPRSSAGGRIASTRSRNKLRGLARTTEDPGIIAPGLSGANDDYCRSAAEAA